MLLSLLQMRLLRPTGVAAKTTYQLLFWGVGQGTGATFYLHSVLCSAQAFWEPLPAGYLRRTGNLRAPDASQMLGINTQLLLSPDVCV